MLKGLALCIILGGSIFGADEEGRDVITRLDTKALALETPDFQVVDRFGDSIASEGPEYNERMWSWSFREFYPTNPPEHPISSSRFLTPDVAIVQTDNNWTALKLDDGTSIPPHGEVNAFTVVRKQTSWRIAL